MNLSTPIEDVPNIGPVYKKRLKKLGINTINDLFFHFPRRYEDFSNLIPIEKLKINEVSTIQGQILAIETTKSWRKKIYVTEAVIKDKTGAVKAIWFNQPYLTRSLKVGDNVFLSGKVIISKKGTYLSNPIHEKGDSASWRTGDLTHTGRLIPIYPETVGLSSRWIRYILKPLLVHLEEQIYETLPKEIIKENDLMPINKALWEIHFPTTLKLSQKAQQRFSFEELFYIELFVLRERNRLSQEKSIPLPIKLDVIQDFVKSLSFKLTDAQKKSSWRILKDLEMPRPMNRLLEGDVGSGKTIVAAMASLNTIKQKYQVAFMAPTEILAKQHFGEVARLFSDFKVNIGLLTGKQDQFRSKKLKNQIIEISRKKLLEKTLAGEMDILIGTHALVQDKVKFGKLGLVILDEQHRFGVKQRAKLCQNQEVVPHLLSMTATPIPRTLALTIYGDLDLSIIDELPKGRKKVITKIIPPKERQETYQFVREEIKNKRQVFIVCPRVEKTEDEEQMSEAKLNWAKVKAVKDEYERLSKDIFPDLKLDILHGKMTPKEKERIMLAFKNKKIDILVSTSVVEVGIDIPNATIMIIEGAERFGLATLHQFRGRVGRGEHQSYCLLFTDSFSPKTRQRLKALITSEDGFSLAEKDLEIRGPGDFKGAKQWGIPDLMMSSLKDISLVEKTRELAKQILTDDPYLRKHPYFLDKLKQFRERIHLE
ncbi:ATP-dependent DNA helicase RecG [Patescibacteria group bacterium]|nr:ATP-dependent DNA helicase RecG [Patescibacteria group bacterium]